MPVGPNQLFESLFFLRSKNQLVEPVFYALAAKKINRESPMINNSILMGRKNTKLLSQSIHLRSLLPGISRIHQRRLILKNSVWLQ
jgi:hypothetical protein